MQTCQVTLIWRVRPAFWLSIPHSLAQDLYYYYRSDPHFRLSYSLYFALSGRDKGEMTRILEFDPWHLCTCCSCQHNIYIYIAEEWAIATPVCCENYASCDLVRHGGMHALDILQSDWPLPDFGNVTNVGIYGCPQTFPFYVWRSGPPD